MMIVVQPWRISEPKDYYGYDVEYIVVCSDHPRYTKGTRFDLGFFKVAQKQGFQVLFLKEQIGNP